MELSDLEICKRIAEIEGIKTKEIHGELRLNQKMSNYDNVVTIAALYSPLTDDALCFQLMVKYKLSLIAPEREQEDWDCVISDVLTVDKSPNKAICLAIIEANKPS